MNATTMGYGVRARERMPFAWDGVTVGLVAALLLVGIIMVTSASMSVAAKEFGNPFYFLERQFLFGLCGVLLAWVVTRVPAEVWEKHSLALLLLGLALLLLVLIPGLGAKINGARRWMRIGPMNFQVSELAKVLVLTWVCSYCVRKRTELETTFPGLLKPVGLLGVAGVLLLAEPDFGATTVLFATGFAVLFVAGARLRYVLFLVSTVAAAFAVLALTSAYRLKRLTVFLHPWDDPFNGGFQLTQSLIAIGRGGWFGVGLGSSIQKLFYLPEAHTDFVFAVLAEELGLLGVIGVIGLFVALVWRALQISRMASQAGLKFQSYVALAFGMWLGLQAIVNIGVNMGVLPTKGLTLPLLSYGRSSLIVSLGWLGVLLRIYHEVKCTSRSAVMRMPGGRSMSAAGPVLIMAGGTGGHIFPALAVAKKLRERGVRVVWLGVPGSMEARLVPANGFPIEWVRVGGIRGKGLGTLIMAPLRIFNAVVQALGVLRRVRPRAVLGAGGYVSGPGGIAARLLGIPLLIHEQNAMPGMTNRWLARVATQVLQGFPGSFAASARARTVGNPVRADIAALPDPTVRFAGRTGRARLLVFGGSLGAQRLNAMVPKALALLAPERRPEVRHQAGERGIEAARVAYREAQVDAEVTPFIDDMAAAYGWADVALCRAGAMTVAELQAVGLGALLVPFPGATDDHQTKNAEALVALGAGRILQERDLTADTLCACITDLTADRARMLSMASAARSARLIDAAEQVADLCLAAAVPA